MLIDEAQALSLARRQQLDRILGCNRTAWHGGLNVSPATDYVYFAECCSRVSAMICTARSRRRFREAKLFRVPDDAGRGPTGAFRPDAALRSSSTGPPLGPKGGGGGEAAGGGCSPLAPDPPPQGEVSAKPTEGVAAHRPSLSTPSVPPGQLPLGGSMACSPLPRAKRREGEGQDTATCANAVALRGSILGPPPRPCPSEPA